MARVVFFYANHNRRYLAAAYQSIQSLRRYNSDVRAILFTERSAMESVRKHFQFENFSAKILTTNNPHAIRNKWLCLNAVQDIGCDQAMMLDVDTVFYADAAKLFDFAAQSGAHLVAREESGTTAKDNYAGIVLPRMEMCRAEQAARDFPIFNMGVLLMDRVGLSLISDGVDFIFHLMSQWKRHPETNPCLGGTHIADEPAYAIYLGTRPESDYAFVPPALSPYFYEVSRRIVPGPGVLTHYWNKYMSLLPLPGGGENPYADCEDSLPLSYPGGPLP